MFAGDISRRLVTLALVNERETNSAVKLKLVESYFAIRLGNEIIKVKQQNLNDFKLQLSDAIKMESQGIINKAERLVVQVGMEHAKQEYEESCKDYKVAQSLFRSLVNMVDTASIYAVTPMFINNSIESADYFISMMKQHNNIVELITLQHDITKLEQKIAKSQYSPDIAFICSQNIFSHGVSRFLVPRNMIGVGFTWNIFDGFSREKKIKQSKLTSLTVELEKQKTINELEVGVEKAHTSLLNSLDNINTLKTAMSLGKELLRIREREFKEGMATSTDVVQARTGLNNIKLAYLLAYYEYDSALITLLSLSGLSSEFEKYRLSGITDDYLIWDP